MLIVMVDNARLRRIWQCKISNIQDGHKLTQQKNCVSLAECFVSLLIQMLLFHLVQRMHTTQHPLKL